MEPLSAKEMIAQCRQVAKDNLGTRYDKSVSGPAIYALMNEVDGFEDYAIDILTDVTGNGQIDAILRTAAKRTLLKRKTLRENAYQNDARFGRF